MKVKIPARIVTACDVCGRQYSLLTKCACCGREYCRTCEAIMAGCIHQPDLCRKCGDIPSVEEVIDKFTFTLSNILDKRNLELRKCRPAKGAK